MFSALEPGKVAVGGWELNQRSRQRFGKRHGGLSRGKHFIFFG
jgi:hypothetical protein